MKMSQLFGSRLKEDPADATTYSHKFLVRGGYVRPVSAGIYSLLPVGKRVIAKIENIIRQEMDRVGGQEVLMPVVLPADLWVESGRYQSVGAERTGFFQGRCSALNGLCRGVERADAVQLHGDSLREQLHQTALHGSHDALDGGAVEHRAVFRHVLAEAAGVQRSRAVDVGVVEPVLVRLSIGVLAQVDAHLNV